MKIFTPLVVLFVLATGCDSPTGAGLELAGGRTGDPVSFDVPPSTFENGPVKDITGGAIRALSGSVDDNLFGSVSSIGYLDFELGTSLTTNFATGPVTSVKLTLGVDYLYGDTTVTSTVSLVDLADEWLDTGVSSDTLLTPGSEVMQSTFSPADSLWAFELPQTWIAENDTTLRSVFFNTAFHGFQLSTLSTGLVAGFSTISSSLEIISGGDTLNFDVGKSLTNVEKITSPIPAERHIMIQDGSRIGVSLYVDDSNSDSLSKSVLSKASLVVVADTLASESPLPNFVRPTVKQLEFYGTTSSGLDVQIRVATIDDDGRFVFDSELYRDVLQQQLSGAPLFESFFLRGPVSDNTLNGILLFSPSSLDFAPRVNITASLFE